MDMAVEFMTQIAKLEGYQQDDAEKLAKQQVQGLSAMGQMFRLTTLKDNTIASSLQYANGQITLNGQKNAVGRLCRPVWNASAFRTGRSGAASTIIALPGVATLHPVCAERRAASTFALPGERLSFDSAHGARREQYAAIFVRPGYSLFLAPAYWPR
ncbi:Putative GTP-binding protein YdgA [Salmonella enterica subsp. enterica serovar Daytona]|uniref:GTP-binding protein YdgA n=1 Tax=Salmonella enterica subsp. enterica serovar Daytona TaxID=1962639 RepID=A0A447JHQ5_SALET|nr:Putative GTP-binding protein YdgA [Salmonella enterica subsp. enterica serovar Daytona]